MPEPLILKEQITIAASLAEGQFREFKTAFAGRPGEKVKRPVKEICRDVGEALVAFANADGGELLIGIDDDGTLTGTAGFTDEEISSIKAAWRTHVHQDTPLNSVLFRDEKVNGHRVVYFRVPKGTKQIHLTSDGRCLRRNDLESVPVAAERIQFERREIASREYDREFVDGASVADLDADLLSIVVKQVSPGISVDKCLQYLGLAEYDSEAGLRLRRAALLLFAHNCDRWHPRVQVRVIKVSGNDLKAGTNYNTLSDHTAKSNVLRLIDEAWESLRPYLVATRFQEDARFRTTYIYPEIACREALVNAIAHRDYSEEGRGIEIYVFENRIEVRNPGGLLSSMSIGDIISLRGVHQSRNSYIARTLREVGVMRELGEGMRRIFETMKTSELAPPELMIEPQSFVLSLHHRPMYSKEEGLWLDQYDSLDLVSEEKAILLMGRRGDLISPNDIIRRIGIVDIEHYRRLVASLQVKGVLESAIAKNKAKQAAQAKGVGMRDFPRFKVKPIKEVGGQASGANAKDPEAPVVKPTLEAPGKSRVGEMEDATALYLANIPPNTTQRDIMTALASFGSPSEVVIPMHDGLSRGYAFVEFEDKSKAEQVLAADIKLGGRTLLIRWKLPQRRRSRRNIRSGRSNGDREQGQL